MNGRIFSTSRKTRSGDVSAYTCVVLIWLCPSIFDTLSMETPSESVICDAKVWRATWKVIGTARKSVEVKIKRKSFEMSNVSVFC